MKLDDSSQSLKAPGAATPPNGLVWMAVTSVGYALGMLLSTYLTGAVARPLSPMLGGLLFVLAYGAVFGIGIGVVQYVALPRGMVTLGVWLPVTVLSAAVGFALAAVVGEFLGNVINPTTNIILGGGTIQDVSGALLGLAIGTAQAASLRRMLPSARGWILATLIGCALGYGTAAAMLEILEVPLLRASPVLSFGAILGLFTGALQALALRSRS